MHRSILHLHNHSHVFPRLAPLFAAAVALFLLATPARAQLSYEREPVKYGEVPVHDRIVKLQERINSGETKLTHTPEHGYLEALLKELEIPASSQALVFSKTSVQLGRISPQRPRAVYFNDDTYLGWVQHSDMLEFASVDPQQGTTFYILSQRKTEKPRFNRNDEICLSCHSSSRTQGVPGVHVRSVYPDQNGQLVLSFGSYTTTHSSPFSQRWGGWYVTGTHGEMRHLGNRLVEDSEKEQLEDFQKKPGENVTDLSPLFNLKPYLTPHSDIVALMVLEHQTQVQNLLTLANFETRSAIHYDGVMNQALGREPQHQSDSTRRRIDDVAKRLVEHLLFKDEFSLSAPVQGTSSFSTEFAASGPKDSQGRSLRQFDLQKRMFKYPLSFMVYSPSFDELPAAVKDVVWAKLADVLSGKHESPDFKHLSADDRQAILEILRATKPSLPPAFATVAPVATQPASGAGAGGQ